MLSQNIKKKSEIITNIQHYYTNNWKVQCGGFIFLLPKFNTMKTAESISIIWHLVTSYVMTKHIMRQLFLTFLTEIITSNSHIRDFIDLVFGKSFGDTEIF